MELMRGEKQKSQGEFNCYCPVCQPTGESNDKRLYYKYANGKLLAHCKHGCNFDDIAKHFPSFAEANQKPKWEFIREHIYHNQDGGIFGKKTYYRVNGEKRPSWYRFEGGEYKSGLQGLKAPLYNILELTQENAAAEPVWIVEGEKDVDTLTECGFLATSPPNGAGYWRSAFNMFFRKRDVIIVPDNDEPGKAHLEKVAKNLKKVAKSVKLIDLTDLVPELKKGGDVSDVFEELSNAKELLLRLVAETDSEKTRNHEVCYVTNSDGKPLKTIFNFKQLLNYAEIQIKNNSILGYEFSGKLPKMTGENVENVSLAYIYSLSQETEIKFSSSEIKKYTIMVADEGTYNPVFNWLNELKLTEVKSIRKYFNCLIFDESEAENRKIYLTLFAKWLVQCIAMQFNTIENPYGADGALGLQSEREGIGKTSFFQNLVFDPRLFKDGVNIDPTDKDSVIKATSFWIVELGEIESTLNKELARLKAFITEAYDSFRVPYAEGITKKPRRTSFCFTCNSNHFLKDGENRRFWVIPIIGVNLEALKKIDIKKVWGEAFIKYKENNQCFRLSKEELRFLVKNNREKFGYRTNEEEVLRDYLRFDEPENYWYYKTSAELSEILFKDKNHARIIGKVLCERFGYTNDNSNLKHYRIKRGVKQYHISGL